MGLTTRSQFLFQKRGVSRAANPSTTVSSSHLLGQLNIHFSETLVTHGD